MKMREERVDVLIVGRVLRLRQRPKGLVDAGLEVVALERRTLPGTRSAAAYSPLADTASLSRISVRFRRSLT